MSIQTDTSLALPCPDGADADLWATLCTLQLRTVEAELGYLSLLCMGWPNPSERLRLATVQTYLVARGVAISEPAPVEVADPVAQPVPAPSAPPEQKPAKARASLPEVTLYTDGSNRGNPGPGGWGALLIMDGKERELSGQIESATNNIAELSGVIFGLRALRKPCKVTLYSDSRYVVDGMMEPSRLRRWVKSGWLTASKEPVANQDLWAQVWDLMQVHTVRALWVRGHNGQPENERVDKLAGAASAAERDRQKGLNHADLSCA